MSVTTRYIVIAIVVVLLVVLVYTIVWHNDMQANIATGLSSTIAVAMLIWAMLRKEKS